MNRLQGAGSGERRIGGDGRSDYSEQRGAFGGKSGARGKPIDVGGGTRLPLNQRKSSQRDSQWNCNHDSGSLLRSGPSPSAADSDQHVRCEPASTSKSAGTVERCKHGGLLERCGVCAGRAIAEANVAALQAREARVTRKLHEQQEGLKENKLKGEISAAYDLLLEEDISGSDSHDQELRMRGPAARNPLVSPKFSRKVHVGAQKKIAK